MHDTTSVFMETRQGSEELCDSKAAQRGKKFQYVFTTASMLTTHRAAHYGQQELVLEAALYKQQPFFPQPINRLKHNQSLIYSKTFLIKGIQRSNDDKRTAVDEKN